MLSFENETERMADGDLAGWSIVFPNKDTLQLWRWDRTAETVAYKRCKQEPVASRASAVAIRVFVDCKLGTACCLSTPLPSR